MSCISEILQKIVVDNNLAVIQDGLIVEGGGKHRGYEWLITFNDMGFRCGYVAISPDHRLYNKDMDEQDEEITVHGGVTFYDNSHIAERLIGHPCEDKWIGFDAGHHNDMPDIEKLKECFPYLKETRKDRVIEISNMFEKLNRFGIQNSSIKDFEFMKSQCKSIIDQIIEKIA